MTAAHLKIDTLHCRKGHLDLLLQELVGTATEYVESLMRIH